MSESAVQVTEAARSFHDYTLQQTYAVGEPRGRRVIPQLFLLKNANWSNMLPTKNNSSLNF